MEWLPAASEDEVNAARQLLSSETLPSTFVPSVKVTVPVGVLAAPSQSASAMKITGSPYLLELIVEARRARVKTAAPAKLIPVTPAQPCTAQTKRRPLLAVGDEESRAV